MRTLILSLFLLGAVAHASPPQLEPWEKQLQSQFDFTDRAQIVQFATFLPKLFGLRFVCQFTSADKAVKPNSVIPGEWVSAPAGGVLHCPDHFDISLEKDAKMRIRQTAGGSPLFFLESGDATFRFEQESLFLETPSFLMALAGMGKGQKIKFSVSPEMETVDCAQGFAAVSYEGKEDKSPGRKLISHECRLDVNIPPDTQPHYVLAGDTVAIENLRLARHNWPVAPKSPQVAGPQLPAWISYNNGRLYYWNTNAREDIDCTLFGQKGENAPMTEISKFKVKTWGGDMPLDRAYIPGTVSLLCDTGKGTVASNLVEVSK